MASAKPRKTVAVILAAGSGVRSRFSRPKQLMKLAGRPVIAHALERFQRHEGIDEIAIVTSQACLDAIEQLVTGGAFPKVARVLLGGSERYHSSLAAIDAYADEAQSHDLKLLFHDAVRPLVSQRVIGEVLAALDYYDAVDVALSVADTVILADPVTDTISDLADRSRVRLGQTPQGFAYPLIRDAYARALKDPDFTTTDDCGVVLKYAPEAPVFVVEGEAANMKLTWPDDLLVLDKFVQCRAARQIAARQERVCFSRLRGQRLVIFGGTSGIGQSMAEIARANGAHVECASRATGVDVRDAGAVADWLEEARGRMGAIDAVVNTAAVLSRMPLASMSREQAADSIATNFTGAVNVAQASYRHLADTRGHLQFFASSSYTYGRALYSTYSASKAAVVNLTQALADEWAEVGIKVNCVNPERARTPMRVKAFGNEPPDLLLEPEVVAAKALGVLAGETSGVVYDVVKA